MKRKNDAYFFVHLHAAISKLSLAMFSRLRLWKSRLLCFARLAPG